MRIKWQTLSRRKKFITFEDEALRKDQNKKTNKLIREYQSKKKWLWPNQRIKILRRIASERFHQENYFGRRKEKHVCSEICDVCGKNKAYFKHHVIPLANGGANSEYNLIPICPDCHAKIHPWLKQ